MLVSMQYCELVKQESDITTMSVLMKDEKKYADCVDVMDTLETWIHDIYTIYTKAKKLSLSSTAPPPPEIFAPSRLDQPKSHSPPEQKLEDALCGVKLPLSS